MAKDILDKCDELMGRGGVTVPVLTNIPEDSIFSSTTELNLEDEMMDSHPNRTSRRNSRLEHDDTQEIEESESRDEIEQSILNSMGGIGRMARWVGIGCNAARNHGKLILSGTGSELVDAGAGAPTASGAGVILNPGREAFVYGKVTCSPQLAAAVTAIVKGERMDWRPMGLKIALYDMPREDVFTQPSGVDWAWAEKDSPAKTIIPLDEEGHWHYSGIAVDTSFLEWAVRNGGNIPVGVVEDLEIWRLWDDNTTVITIADNTAGTDLGLNTWILSHLTYPLAWTFDTFRVKEIGSSANTTRTFLRTASLVDINDKADRIIFVVPTKTKNSVDVAMEPKKA